MAETQTAPKAKLDSTPVTLTAQAHMPIRYLKEAGVEFSNAIWGEWLDHENGVRIERGTHITVQKHVADKLMKIMVKSIKPRQTRRSIPAFIIAQG